MKRHFLLFLLMLTGFTSGLYAQFTPQGFSYQSIVRDLNGDPLGNQTVSLLFTIRSGAPNGPIAYSEKQTMSTNNYGLVNTAIGTGTPIQGTFPSINWGGGAKYLTVSLETSPNVFDELGSTQLMSVPYALYAQTAANGGGGGGGDNWGSQVVQTGPALNGNGTAASPLNIAPQGAQTGQVLKWDGTKWIPQDDVSSTGTGGGTLTQINTGPGLTGGPITTTGTIGLSNTGVTPGSYGSASQIPVITVDAQGRVTGVFNTVASPGTVGINAGGGIGVQQNGTTYTISNTGVLTTTQADGDVTGVFNNLQIEAGAVGSPELANGSVTAAKLNSMSATNGQVIKWNGTAWAPAADQGGATTNILPGLGISVTGAAPNLTINNTGDTNPNDDVTTSSLADGDVSGPFSNLQIKPNVVGTTEVADNAITTAKVNNGAITAAKLNSMSATNGQVLKWNGTAWAPAADQTGAGIVVNAGPGIDVAASGSTFTVINTGDTNGFDDLTLSSTAAGDISGPFSNLQINPFAVTNTELANNAVGTTNVINGAITGAKINNMGAANGQVLKWNGTTWAPANDNNSGGAGDNWGTQVASTNLTLTGNGTIGQPLGIAPQGATAGQVLKYNGINWFPAIDFNDGPDNWGTQVVEVSQELAGDGTAANKLSLAPQGALPGQVLKFNGSIWEPAADENDGGDDWGTQSTVTNPTMAGNGTLGSPLGIAPQSASNGQVLKFNGSTWVPGADNNDGGDDWGSQSTVTNPTMEGNGTLGSPLGIAPQGASTGQVLKFDGLTWVPGSDNSGGAGDFYTQGTGISITGSSPNFVINNTGDNDNNPTNELQMISLTGNTLNLSNGGGSVVLPVSSGDTYNEGVGINITGSSPNFTIENTGDLSNTNEIQALSLSGNTLNLSNGGGSVVLPDGDTYTAGTGINISGSSPNFTITNTGDTDNNPTNEIQDLSINGTLLEISGGGTGVDLNDFLLNIGQGFWALNGTDINNVNAGNVLVGNNTPGTGKFQVKTTGGTAGFFASVGGNALLTGDGNVGINTNAPGFRLDVSGDQRVRGTGNLLTLEQATGGDYARLLFKNAGSTGSWIMGGQGTGADGDFFLTYAQPLVPGASRIITARSNGSVGIGDANLTDTRLRVFHGSSSGLGIENSNSGAFWEFWVRDNDGALVLFNNVLGGVPAGTFAPNGMYTASDRRLKSDVAAIQGSFLDKIMKLEAYTYRYSAENADAKRSIGFMAQDVQAQFPELVTENKNRDSEGSFLSLNYAGISVVAIKAIQEQQAQIKELQRENEALKQQMSEFDKRLKALEDQHNKGN